VSDLVLVDSAGIVRFGGNRIVGTVNKVAYQVHSPPGHERMDRGGAYATRFYWPPAILGNGKHAPADSARVLCPFSTFDDHVLRSDWDGAIPGGRPESPIARALGSKTSGHLQHHGLITVRRLRSRRRLVVHNIAIDAPEAAGRPEAGTPLTLRGTGDRCARSSFRTLTWRGFSFEILSKW